MNSPAISIRNKVIFLAIFSTAMGFLEAAVVVYLRQLYYPEGFSFPLKMMAFEDLTVEYIREISTIVMLFSVGIVAGRNFYERFSYFLICFGIWDIFYYIWLKILLDWPPSLLTWDILFLIPVIWAGPVLAPLICAFTMVMVAGFLLYFQQKEYSIRISLFEWTLMVSGSLIIFSTFVWEYSKLIIIDEFMPQFLTLRGDPYFEQIIADYVPRAYNWPLFSLGESFLLSFFLLFCRRIKLLNEN
ncbi:MAG: hypothetical protein AB1638_06275 [Nitrospirota bacterium]